jgi:hypothetical protein
VGNNQTITSTFTLRQFVITAANVPGGHVSNPGSLFDDISCGALSSDCTATVDYNYPVTLVAEPDPEHVFVKWTGTACNGSTNPECSFKMPLGNVSIAPSYRLRTNIILMKDGNGKATIVSTPAGLNCLPNQGMCSADFFNGTPVTLRATPGRRHPVPGLQRRLHLEHDGVHLHTVRPDAVRPRGASAPPACAERHATGRGRGLQRSGRHQLRRHVQ